MNVVASNCLAYTPLVGHVTVIFPCQQRLNRLAKTILVHAVVLYHVGTSNRIKEKKKDEKKGRREIREKSVID